MKSKNKTSKKILAAYGEYWTKKNSITRQDGYTFEDLVDETLQLRTCANRKEFESILALYHELMESLLTYLDLWKEYKLYGFVSSKRLEQLLTAPGQFLLRFSKSSPRDIAVSCMNDEHVLEHVLIAKQYIDQYTLGNIVCEVALYKILVKPNGEKIPKYKDFAKTGQVAGKYKSLLSTLTSTNLPAVPKVDLATLQVENWSDTTNLPPSIAPPPPSIAPSPYITSGVVRYLDDTDITQLLVVAADFFEQPVEQFQEILARLHKEWIFKVRNLRMASDDTWKKLALPSALQDFLKLQIGPWDTQR